MITRAGVSPCHGQWKLQWVDRAGQLRSLGIDTSRVPVAAEGPHGLSAMATVDGSSGAGVGTLVLENFRRRSPLQLREAARVSRNPAFARLMMVPQIGDNCGGPNTFVRVLM